MASDELHPVDIDRLADYIGGALDGADEAAVAQLISDDPRWRETYESLTPGMTAVGDELRALGSASDPMPADLAVRLEEAFSSAAEPQAQPAPADRHLSSVPDTGGSPRRRRARWVVPIAAAAGVLAFAGFGVDYLAGQTGGSDSAESTAAGGAADQAAPAPMMGSDSAGREAAPSLRDDQILRSGTNYTAASLAAAPIQSFSSDGTRAAAPDAVAKGQLADGLARLTDHAALQACIAAIAQLHGSGQILVETVDYARYDDRPALVVHFTSDGATWAYATGPDCGTQARGAELLQRVKVR